MDEFAPEFEQKHGCVFWFLVLLGVIGLGAIFLDELLFIWGALRSLARSEPAPKEFLDLVLFLLGVAIGGGVFGMVVVLLLAQVALPVSTGEGRRHVAERLFGFLNGFGLNWPVIFVKEGSIAGLQVKPEKVSGGVAIVDLDSAIVLERSWHSLSLGVGGSLDTSRSAARSQHPGRVGGPGVVFIGLNERLRGLVSLRKQFRINLNVRAYTNDGIEIQNHVFAIFTLGQAPTVYKVAYMGEMLPENIRVIQIDESTKKVKAITDDLDEIDRVEVHQFAQVFLTSREVTASLEPNEKGKEYPPYVIDEQRILNAVYSQARRVGDSTLDQWTDLPAFVATEVYRNLISQVAYDDIYMPKDAQRFPLQQDIKPRFARMVKSLGAMSFEFIHRLDDMPIEIGQKVDNRFFRMSTVRPFHSSKVLRDRGIKVIHAGFTDLNPTDPIIRRQRLENWRAHWQQQTDTIRAEHDREAAQILGRARAEKQKDIIATLSGILQSPEYSEEVLVLHIFQALEDFTTDPAARKILPRDSINLLRNLQMFLLPDDRPTRRMLPERNLEEGEV